MMKGDDRRAYQKWQWHYEKMLKNDRIDYFEDDDAKRSRIAYLEGDFFAWCRYHFPEVTRSEFAPWHRRYCLHIIDNDECYFVGKISRDMAKSSVTAMLMVYLHITKRAKVFAMLSKTFEKAVLLLNPVRRAFLKDSIIRDYGNLIGMTFTEGFFETTLGGQFVAAGSGQSIRGIKSEESLRLEVAVFDDFDDDEVCRSPERMENAWQYVLAQVYPAFHVSGRKRIIHINNRIAEDTITQRAWEHAPGQMNELCITVNLTDSNGKSNWPECYTDAECAAMINLVGMYAGTEYFNKPRKKGTVFKPEWIQWRKLPPLKQYKYLVAYLDGGFKKSKTSDTKALVLIGMMNGVYHVRRAYVDNTTVDDMISWHYDLMDKLKIENSTAVFWMEEVFLLSLLHEHFDAAVKKYGRRVPMRSDKRKKPDKDLRIQNLAGYFEREHFIFDEDQKDNRHMKRLVNQFLDFIPGSKGHEKDGPDACEGAIHMLQAMIGQDPEKVIIGARHQNSKRV